MVDRTTSVVSWPSSVRVFVDVDLSKSAPPQILIQLLNGRSIWQDIVYEKRSLVCGDCHCISHESFACPGAQRASVPIAGSPSVVATPSALLSPAFLVAPLQCSGEPRSSLDLDSVGAAGCQSTAVALSSSSSSPLLASSSSSSRAGISVTSHGGLDPGISPASNPIDSLGFAISVGSPDGPMAPEVLAALVPAPCVPSDLGDPTVLSLGGALLDGAEDVAPSAGVSLGCNASVARTGTGWRGSPTSLASPSVCRLSSVFPYFFPPVPVSWGSRASRGSLSCGGVLLLSPVYPAVRLNWKSYWRVKNPGHQFSHGTMILRSDSKSKTSNWKVEDSIFLF